MKIRIFSMMNNCPFSAKYLLLCLSLYGCTGYHDSKGDTRYAPPVIPAKQMVDAEGKQLFQQHCETCHPLVKDEGIDLTSMLRGAGRTYFMTYLGWQDSLLAVKDPLAMDLKQKWNNQTYTHHFRFSDPELGALIRYLNEIQ